MSRFQLAKITILALALVVAAALIWGPLWIVPVHPASGLRYDQLDSHAQFAHLYVPPRAPQNAMAVFVVCLALWGTNLIPLAYTGLLAVALLPVLGVVPAKQAFSYFGNSAVFFILSVFLLAAAMIRTGLSKRLTLMLLERFDRTPAMLVTGVACSAAFLAMWMPAHAVAAMMFPIVAEVADSLNLRKPGSVYARMLFFALAWGAIIGGVGTFLGGARAPLALELLHDAYRSPDGGYVYNVTFLGWMRAAMPVVILLAAIAVVVLRRCFQSEVNDISAATRMLHDRVAALGPMSGRERRLAFVGVATILCWALAGHRVDLAVIATLAAVALAVLRIVTWNDVQEYVNWGVVVMYGGAVALGGALKDTHAMLWVAHTALPGGVSPMLLIVVLATVSVVLSSGISNAAAVAVLLPVGFALAEQTTPALHPLAVMYAVAIPAGLAFALPISSPPNAIAFASGYYSMRTVPKYGVPLTVVAMIVFLLVALVYWPVAGIPVTVDKPIDVQQETLRSPAATSVDSDVTVAGARRLPAPRRRGGFGEERMPSRRLSHTHRCVSRDDLPSTRVGAFTSRTTLATLESPTEPTREDGHHG